MVNTIPQEALNQIKERRRRYEELLNAEVPLPSTMWASYVPRYRNGSSNGFKVHQKEHLARHAVRMSGGTGVVYFLCGGDWLPHEVYVDGTEMHR